MREAVYNINVNCWYNEPVITDPNFVFSHFQIGNDWSLHRGFATIGGIRQGDHLFYSIALCSPVDNFSKAKGRALVEDHFSNPKSANMRGVFNIIDIKDLQPTLVLKAALEHHLRTRHLPKWTKQSVFFRKKRRVRKSKATSSVDNPKSREAAALKAWATRRRNGWSYLK